MGDPLPDREGLGPLIDRLKALEKQVLDLQRPTGTQYANAVGNLVDFGSIGLSATGFTVPTTEAVVVSGAMDIPEGFTRAAVLGIVSLGAWNGSATSNYIYVRAGINGTAGASLPELATPSSYRALTVSAIRTLKDLTPGGTIQVDVRCNASSGWGSNVANIANIDVIALFRR